jgi:integrase/recombinase XerD
MSHNSSREIINITFNVMITLAALEGAYAPNTVTAYERDAQKFASWCEGRGYPSFPATPALVLEFVEACGRDCLARTVRRHLIAVGMLHRLNGVSDPTTGHDVTLALRRLARARRLPPRQARGLAHAELQSMLAAMPRNLVGRRDAAMLALGYEILGRRAEVVALRDTDLEFRENGTLRVTISRSKCDQTGLGRFAYPSRGTATLVANWIAERGCGFPFLFCPIYRGRPIGRGLHSVTVVRAMRVAAKRAGLSQHSELSGHSLRVGAAQELLVRGFDTVAIARAGGWRSIATLSRYLEAAQHSVWD